LYIHFSKAIDIILHLDKYLQVIVSDNPTLTYVLLFLIIFLETGVVITPFLPGDSILLVAGALAARDLFNIEILFVTILIAAILGDALNYHIGKFAGPKIFKKEESLLLNKEYLLRAQMFYEKHGKKTIIIARFVPIIRTFAPFVAGIGKMPYRTFLAYNIIGAILWCGIFIIGGFLFGNMPWVQAHFGSLILSIIFISLLPFGKELVCYFIAKARQNKHKKI